MTLKEAAKTITEHTLSIQDAADILWVSPTAVYARITSGELDAVRLGPTRVTKASLVQAGLAMPQKTAALLKLVDEAPLE